MTKDDIIKDKTVRMEYSRFDELITRKYGVVVEGWPLKPFRRPGEVQVSNELQVLHDAWKTGRAKFVKLTKEQLSEWEEKRAAGDGELGRDQGAEENEDEAVEENGAGGEESPADGAAAIATGGGKGKQSDPAAPSHKRKRRTVEIGTDADGHPLVVEKRQRKKRSDAGVPRGPRKKNQETTPTDRVSPEIRSPALPPRVEREVRAAANNSVEAAAEDAAAAAAAESAALALAAGQAAMTVTFSLA